MLPLNRLSLLCNCCLVAVILIFCLGSKEVFAESNGQISVNATKSMVMDEMVVNGTKKERDFRIGDVDLESSPIFFSVINKEQFEGKIVSLAEVIEKEAGVQVRQSGGLGSFSSVSLRGSSSDQVMVFLDGVLLNDASGGGVDLSNISLSDVESIEIYRGITPANFGRSSIGGAINIRTNR
ncbi:MAG TPA: TonB-dependent receptor plug domain-containing protein, partial [Desulfohalobiaceae bacterium]|nr:TonB-dependent receptor plug domain-containing protein [Desulfohalobiaceae bacterium]